MRSRIQIAALCLLATGCGSERHAGTGADSAPATAQPVLPGSGPGGVEALREAYLDFQTAKGRPPASFSELASYSLDASRPLPPDVASLTVAWGTPVGPRCPDQKPGELVVAHRLAPDGSVQVMTADGHTGTMTAEEFKTARKAGK